MHPRRPTARARAKALREEAGLLQRRRKLAVLLVAFLAAAFVLLAAGTARGAELPEDIEWETNMDDPPIGSPDAIRGGTFYTYLPSYPLTFRLHGPNSNDMFASWRRSVSSYLPLVSRHPTTDNYIPILATHWSVQDDYKTIFYRLDPDARWSDGEPITADDYVFAFEFLQDPRIRDPFSNRYMEDYFESVDKIDDHTIRIVGKQESWRPLSDYGFSPLPAHAIELDEEWTDRDNYTPPVVQGPYVISSWRTGERVEMTRIDDWWGDEKHYLQGMFNPDRIVVRVIADTTRALDFFQRGQLSYLEVNEARMWANQMDFEALRNGWAHRKQVFVETPQGLYGMIFNLERPLFQSRDFRKALQYLLDFEKLNSQLMHNAYYRIVSAFEGTPYQNPDIVPYGFDPRRAREHLRAAGFTERGRDGILRNAQGQPARFTLIYPSQGLERHLTVIQNDFRRAGVDLRLQLMDGGAAFNRALERGFDAIMISMSAGFYPAPHQYFHSDFKGIPQNNNFWSYGSERTDELIDTYRFSMDEEERLAAMHELDAIIQDDAIWIPFWMGPYVRFVYWDYVQWPDFYFHRRARTLTDNQVFWIDPERQERLDRAMSEGRALEPSTEVEVDPYGVLEELEKQAKAAEAEE